MEIRIQVGFSIQPEQEVLWNSIFTGLANGETGFKFQNRMSAFGEAVDEKLDEMADEWPMLYFTVEQWSCSECVIAAVFLTGSEGEYFAEDLQELFELCGVTDLKVKPSVDCEL